ncbi:SRPBCC family protein [Ekhidna sp.]|uniref:SRPBCC family protein n=1 Tax=Ekhidna sp. TaxID=2608089 RepID=UPI003CCBD0C6
MRIKIATEVQADLEQVKSGFNEDLFLSLNPPFPPVKLKEFGGCKTGDMVALELNFILFKQVWKSEITEDNEEAGNWYFVDQGVKLPFFLKSWKHHHGVDAREKGGSTIIDDITYSTGIIATDLLMYPLLYFQFLYRKPIYKRRFRG